MRILAALTTIVTITAAALPARAGWAYSFDDDVYVVYLDMNRGVNIGSFVQVPMKVVRRDNRKEFLAYYLARCTTGEWMFSRYPLFQSENKWELPQHGVSAGPAGYEVCSLYK